MTALERGKLFQFELQEQKVKLHHSQDTIDVQQFANSEMNDALVQLKTKQHEHSTRHNHATKAIITVWSDQELTMAV